MAAVLLGEVDWSLDRDKEGHRDYSIKWLIETDDPMDGPAIVLQTPFLPQTGSPWIFGNDNDPWAFCWPDWKIKPVITMEPNCHWTVEQTFSTRPLRRCQDTSIENPLAEPARLSGSFVKYTEEAWFDRFGKPIVNSAKEQITGQEVEFDAGKPNVIVGMNFLSLPLTSFAQYMHRVNDAPLWGLAKRCVKLSDAKWQRQLYGTCVFYYTVEYEFDIQFDTFDRLVADVGTVTLEGGGDPDDPEDYVRYRDTRGDARKIPLNGAGAASTNIFTDHPPIKVEKYLEINMLLLGIPSSL